MDNLTEQAPNAIAVPQIEEMTTPEIKQAMEHGSPNWVTLQQMGMVQWSVLVLERLRK